MGRRCLESDKRLDGARHFALKACLRLLSGEQSRTTPTNGSNV